MNYGKGSNLHADYHTQRNNAVDPHGTCNVTSYVMAAKRAGCLFPYPDGVQPEDYFARFLLSAEGKAKMKELAPWACLKTHNPNEIHAVLEWGFNTLADGIGRAEFRTNWELRDIVYLVQQGAGVVISGGFPHYKHGRIGHVVSVAGASYKGDTLASPNDFVGGNLEHLLIDDPYGNYHTLYSPKVAGYDKGNDVVIPLDDLLKILKKGDGYWAHAVMRIPT